MDRNFAAITIFTFLFAVSSARISLDPTPTNLHHVAHSSFHWRPNCAVEDSSLRFVSSGMKKPLYDGTLESDKDRDVRVDLMPRSDIARFHAINRRFFNEPRVPIRPRPQNPFLKPRPKTKNENEGTIKETVQGQASSKWLKFKHDYQHERYQHQHQHHDIGNNNNNVLSSRKHKFVVEKMNSLAQQHKAKTRVPEASFLRSIRKFMKHSFD